MLGLQTPCALQYLIDAGLGCNPLLARLLVCRRVLGCPARCLDSRNYLRRVASVQAGTPSCVELDDNQGPIASNAEIDYNSPWQPSVPEYFRGECSSARSLGGAFIGGAVEDLAVQREATQLGREVENLRHQKLCRSGETGAGCLQILCVTIDACGQLLGNERFHENWEVDSVCPVEALLRHATP